MKLLFIAIFFIDTNELLMSLRRQYEELEREKQNASLDQISREQTYRSELEQLAIQKEYEPKEI